MFIFVYSTALYTILIIVLMFVDTSVNNVGVLDHWYVCILIILVANILTHCFLGDLLDFRDCASVET